MTQYVCDRCGKATDAENQIKKVEWKDRCHTSKSCDLCFGCLSALADFLKPLPQAAKAANEL